MIEDEYLISLAPDTPEGKYWLAVGLYSLESMERLSVLDRQGRPRDTRVLLGPIQVR